MIFKTALFLIFILLSSAVSAFEFPQFKPSDSPWKIYLYTGFGVGTGDYSALSRWTSEHNRSYYSSIAASGDIKYAGCTITHETPGNTALAMDYSAEVKCFYRNFGAGLGFGRGGFSTGENSFIIESTGDTMNVLRNRFIVYSYTLNAYYKFELSKNGRFYLFPSAGVNFNTAKYSYKITSVKYSGAPPYQDQFEAIFRGSGVSWNVAAGTGYDFNLIAVESLIRMRIGEIANMKAHDNRMRFEDGSPVVISLNDVEIVFNVGIHF